MKPLGIAVSVAGLLATVSAFIGNAAGRFDQKLSSERQILHVVNRLTFGPHAGDIEQVRRIGVEKWIDLQLHPDRISENPLLEAKLKPLETLQLTVWQIQEKYPAVPPAIAAFRPPSVAAMQSLTPLQSTTLFQGSVAERQTMLASLPPDTRRLVLGAAPPQTLEGLPADLQQEAANARQADQEARQKEIRRLMPPLNDLLSPAEIRTAQQGTIEEKQALLNSFDPEKRRQVVRSLPPQALAEVPQLRREAMAARQPQELVNSELIESKLYRAIYSNRQLQEVLVDF